MGSALVRKLIDKKYAVRVLDNNSRGSLTRLSDFRHSFQIFSGDIRNPSIVKKATKGVETVIHLASINGTELFYQKPDEVLDVSIRGLLTLLDACQMNNVKECFFTSSSEVNPNPTKIPTDESIPLVIPDPTNPRFSYAAGKIASEMMLLYQGRKIFKRMCIIRPHNVYGPDMGWEHVIPQLTLRMRQLPQTNRTSTFQIQGTGRETRSFIYIDDFVDGLMLVLQKGKNREIYNIGVQEETTIRHLTTLIAKTLGRNIRIAPGKLQPGSPLRRCPDTTKLRALRFEPSISLQEGVKRTVLWYDAHANEKP